MNPYEELANMGYDLRYIHKLHIRALEDCKIQYSDA